LASGGGGGGASGSGGGPPYIWQPCTQQPPWEAAAAAVASSSSSGGGHSGCGGGQPCPFEALPVCPTGGGSMLPDPSKGPLRSFPVIIQSNVPPASAYNTGSGGGLFRSTMPQPGQAVSGWAPPPPVAGARVAGNTGGGGGLVDSQSPKILSPAPAAGAPPCTPLPDEFAQAVNPPQLLPVETGAPALSLSNCAPPAQDWAANVTNSVEMPTDGGDQLLHAELSRRMLPSGGDDQDKSYEAGKPVQVADQNAGLTAASVLRNCAAILEQQNVGDPQPANIQKCCLAVINLLGDLTGSHGQQQRLNAGLGRSPSISQMVKDAERKMREHEGILPTQAGFTTANVCSFAVGCR